MRNQHPQCPGYLPTEKNFQTQSKPRHRGQDGAGGSDQRGQGAVTEPRISPSANPGQEGGAGGRGTPPPTFQALLRVGAHPAAPQLLVKEPDDGVGQALLLRHPGGRSVPPRGSHPAGNGAA